MTTWRIGELAEATGLTVRTLHHYDEIGLLVPSERTDSGHRIYREGDAQRLYRICALRSLGLPLAEIADVLESESIGDVLIRHLDHLDAEVRRVTRIRDRVRRLVSYAGDEVDAGQLLELVAAMTEMESYFSAAQLDALARRRRQGGADRLRTTEEWRRLADELRPLQLAGVSPTSPEVRRIAGEADRLIDQFTGGDTRMREALARLRERLPVDGLAGWDAELLDYLYEALDTLGDAST